VINYVTLRGANGCLRVALAPCGRHSCDPRKLDVQFFFFFLGCTRYTMHGTILVVAVVYWL